MNAIWKKSSWNKSDIIAISITILISLLLLALPINKQNKNQLGSKEKARVLAVDNSQIQNMGLVKLGTQILKVQILSGEHKGEFFSATNELLAQMELDKIFKENDTILVGIINNATPETTTINAQDYYRTNWSIILFSLFAILLILFGGVVGLKAFISFIFNCVIILKIIIPLCLVGIHPLLVVIISIAILTFIIIFLVANFTRKGVTAFLGSMLGILFCCGMSEIFTNLFKINGAVMPYSQALLYSGYEFLSLSNIFIGAVILSSSGAVMDLAMDVAAGMEEIYFHKNNIACKELISSGIRIGQSVVGTMTTTLLLAYSGGYLTLMMTFIAQGMTFVDFINNPYVSAEVVKTLVGSFSLVLVAPFTAIVGGFIFTWRRNNKY